MRTNLTRLALTVATGALALSLTACGNSNVPSASHPVTHVQVSTVPAHPAAATPTAAPAADTNPRSLAEEVIRNGLTNPAVLHSTNATDAMSALASQVSSQFQDDVKTHELAAERVFAIDLAPKGVVADSAHNVTITSETANATPTSVDVVVSAHADYTLTDGRTLHRDEKVSLRMVPGVDRDQAAFVADSATTDPADTANNQQFIVK